jgi:hypothetical protein
MTDLDIITSKFGHVYAQSKAYTNDKDTAQKLMFESFTQAAKNGALAQRIIDNPSRLSNAEYVQKNFPGWRLVKARNHRTVMIEEDPEFVKYTYINKSDGMVYGRTVAESGLSLDDTALREDNPELWNQISEWPEPLYTMLWQIIDRWAGYPAESDELVIAMMSDFGIQRKVRPPSDWTPEQTEAVGPYMIPGKLTVRLVVPRKATEEELEGDE